MACAVGRRAKQASLALLSIETIKIGCATAVDGGAARGSAWSATRGSAVRGRMRLRHINKPRKRMDTTSINLITTSKLSTVN